MSRPKDFCHGCDKEGWPWVQTDHEGSTSCLYCGSERREGVVASGPVVRCGDWRKRAVVTVLNEGEMLVSPGRDEPEGAEVLPCLRCRG